MKGSAHRSRKRGAARAAELALDFPSPDAGSAALPLEAEEIAASPLDKHFAALMTRLNGVEDLALERAASAVSAWRAAGHSCMPLRVLGSGPELTETLRRTQVVGAPGEWKPLILDVAGRLYLQRYWQYEQQLAAAIRARVSAGPPAIDQKLLARGLDEHFSSGKSSGRRGSKPAPDDQRIAAETALTSRFCVISGGPGTGKTRTLARVIALLQAQLGASGAAPRLALAAPTGKAAARMTESIRQMLAEFPHISLPAEAVTLHALLGLSTDSALPRHHAKNPLSIDAVIVDEASMIDLALMAKLFDATPAEARIILLGDRDQLASVEAGHVLGDICGERDAMGSAPLRRHVIVLHRNYRFHEESGIRQLSDAVNAGDAEKALRLLTTGETADVSSGPVPSPAALESAVRDRIVSGYRAMLEAKEPRAALEAHAAFRLLCAVRRGPFGVENLNRVAERVLAAERLIAPGAAHYAGRPIMVLRNDYQLRLFNGDVGVILPDAECGGALRAFFPGSDGKLRALLPARLPEHETVWAMTVHKSQGSEFGRVLFLLPDRESPLLTRELVYTAITRARSAVEMWFCAPVLRAAIERRTERTSGLRDALWG